MNILDTRDLIEEREENKQTILESFLETFEQYAEQTESFEDILFEEEEIESWKEQFEYELNLIKEIDELEEEILNGEWEYGTTLIEEDEFEEYCEDLLIDCGYISKDFPSWIVIDWENTTDNMKQDYSEVEFRGTTYLYR